MEWLVPWRAGLVIAALSVAAATLAGVGPALRVRVVEALSVRVTTPAASFHISFAMQS